MNKDDLINAINNLRPGSQFTFENADYSTINWIILEGNAPTKKQIDDEIKRLQSNQITESETKATAKAALLERLGITADEAALLLA